MRLRTSRILVVLVSAAAVTVPLASATGTPAAARTAMHEVPHTSALQNRIRAYWTPRRMRDVAERRGSSSGGALWTGGGAVARTTGKVFFTLGGRDYLCSAGT